MPYTVASEFSFSISNLSYRSSEGPAVTLVEYRIDPKTADEFLEAMKEMKRIRQRDGPIRWNLLRDTTDTQRYIESFVTESWADHLRQHERMTAEDREVEQRAQAFHLDFVYHRVVRIQLGRSAPKPEALRDDSANA